MKATEIAALLSELADLCTENTTNHLVLKALSSVLEAHKEISVTEFVKLVKQRLKKRTFELASEGESEVAELVLVLDRLSRLFSKAKAVSCLSELKRLRDLFSVYRECNLDNLLAELKMLKPAIATRDVINLDELIAYYITALKEAKTDNNRFSDVFAKLVSDRDVSRKELATIMEAYTGLSSGRKAKNELLQGIRAQFAIEVLQQKNLESLRGN